MMKNKLNREADVFRELSLIELDVIYNINNFYELIENAFSNYYIDENEWKEDFQYHWGTFLKDIDLRNYNIDEIHTIECFGNMYCDYGDIYVDICFEKIDDNTIKLLNITY